MAECIALRKVVHSCIIQHCRKEMLCLIAPVGQMAQYYVLFWLKREQICPHTIEQHNLVTDPL